MKLTKTLTAVAGLTLAAGPVNAAVVLSFEDFEAATNNTDFANTDYVPNNDNTIDLNGFQSLSGPVGENTTQTNFMRSSNRLITLRDALPLASNAHTSVTVEFDYMYHNYSNTDGTQLEYSAAGDFSDTTVIFEWDSNLVPNDEWVIGASATILPGAVTGGFTDTAKIRFRSGGFANSRHDYADNIKITGVGGVPEPSTTALLGLGGLALILRRRK